MTQNNQSSASQPTYSNSDMHSHVLDQLAKKYGTTSDSRTPILAGNPAPQAVDRPINIDNQAILDKLSQAYKAKKPVDSTTDKIKRLYGV